MDMIKTQMSFEILVQYLGGMTIGRQQDLGVDQHHLLQTLNKKIKHSYPDQQLMSLIGRKAEVFSWWYEQILFDIVMVPLPCYGMMVNLYSSACCWCCTVHSMKY